MEASTPKPDDVDILPSWCVFLVTIVVAGAVDLLVVSRPREAQAGGQQSPTFVRQIAFWLAAGALFNAYVLLTLGQAAAGNWAYGYILEYMLSVDNLFVFQMIFKGYSTPAAQVDRALFWGISAAVVLRLAFFGVGTELLAMGAIPRVIFGGVLVWSGAKTLKDSEDSEDDPRNNPVVRCITSLLPVHDEYGADPVFFIRVDASTETQAPPAVLGKGDAEMGNVEMAGLKEGRAATPVNSSGENSPSSDAGLFTGMNLEIDPAAALDGASACSTSKSAGARSVPGGKLKVTLLCVVVITLGIIDIVFAVDSVTAKVSSVVSFSFSVNFFLNLTSSAFAMFVLRSLYFVVDMLTHMFRFLNYGVGIVLVFIGVKLILGIWFEIGMLMSCLFILGALLVSILASWLLPEEAEAVEAGEAPESPSQVWAAESPFDPADSPFDDL